MDAFAPPSTRAEPRGRRLLRGAGAVAATLAIWVSLFSVPGRTEPQLDASWQEMLIYAREHGLQFGRDIIFTWGPWGFLCSLAHLGKAEAAPILAWQVAGQRL